MKSGETEPCTLKWLRLLWIQVLWLTGSCSGGVVLVHVGTGGNTSPAMHWQSEQQPCSMGPFASTVLISFSMTWGHLYPERWSCFSSVSWGQPKSWNLVLYLFLSKEKLFILSHRNVKQMTRTSAQFASHICSPMVKVIMLTYCHPSYSPPVWGDCNGGCELWRKREGEFHPPWTFHFYLYPLRSHLALR